MTTKPFLILQLRSGDVEADDEFNAFLRYGCLSVDDVHRVRMEQGVLPTIDLDEYAGVMVGGGPWNVSDPLEKQSLEQRAADAWLDALMHEIVERDKPYLGMCYGIGALARTLACKVSKERYGEEAGPVTITLTDEGVRDPLLTGVARSFRAFCGHKEACQSVPEGVVLLASSETCPVQMVRFGGNVYATQFHTELDADGIHVRVNVYKDHGYFDPNDADALIARCRAETVVEPMKILRNFVNRYR